MFLSWVLPAMTKCEQLYVSTTSITGMDDFSKVAISLPTVLLKRTDKVRMDVPRSTFIRRAVEKYLGRKVI